MVQIAFYIDKSSFVDYVVDFHQRLALVDRIKYLLKKSKIKSWLWHESVHVEIIIDDYWYTSSPIDGGVVKRKLDYDHCNWYIVDLDLKQYQKIKLIRFLESKLGLKYDFTAIMLTQFLPFDINKDYKYICSELCAEALDHIGYFHATKHFNWYSPSRLHEIIDRETLKT